MAETSNLAARFMELFAGSEQARGTYRPPEQQAPAYGGGKLEIKTSARTLRERVTLLHWADHLAGRVPLGVVPIREDDTCLWGCIDVDKYDLNLADLARRVSGLDLPLHVGRSKSGGAHVFLFLESPAPALDVQRWLKDVAARLGQSGAEIFPKQTRVLREQGDLGNWMIMPYFGDTMPMLRAGGGEYTPEEFLRVAERGRASPSILALPAGNDPSDELSVADGPPCLQHMRKNGFPPHSRNKGLMALGVYAKKRWPQNWEAKLEEFNRVSFDEPLPSEEVLGVKRSLQKKDYFYSCNDFPLNDHCNSRLCRRRRYGVNDGEGDAPPFELGAMSVLATEPPLWFLVLDEDTLELSTDQLLDYKKFQKVVAERLLRMLPALRVQDWTKMVARAMESVVRIETSPDVGIRGVLHDRMEEFLTNRQRGRRIEDILSGRPWEDEETRRHYFQLSPLMEHLRKDPLFKDMSRGTLVQRIKDMGGGEKFLNIRGKGRNCWWLPASVFTPHPEVGSPEIEKEVM